MRHQKILLFGLIALLLLGLGGCAKYKITTPLEQSLNTTASWRIGEIRDGLPSDMDPEDKPDEFNIMKLKNFLKEELEKRNLFQETGLASSDQLEVTGNILEYKKGSGLVRALIGFGIGNAVLTIELELRNRTTGKTLFAGNFKQTVSDWKESGEKCFKRVAKDFAKALEKQQKKLLKGS